MLIEIQVGVESIRVNEIFKLEWIMVIEYCFLDLGISERTLYRKLKEYDIDQ